MGCCYHQVSEATPRWKEDGRQWRRAEVPNFPMSRFAAELDISLGEMARHLALQNVHSWPEPHTPLSDAISRNRHHFHRCLLECRLEQIRQSATGAEMGYKPDGHELPREGNVGQLAPCATFEEYAQHAAARLRIDFSEQERARMLQIHSQYETLERPLRAFQMLRGLFARPIERLLLIDRLLFLEECAQLQPAQMLPVQTELVPVFDPLTSPRNTAVVAFERSRCAG